ncbi:MAG: endonuclease/exonuclease/phosphatase family protein [Paludibacteraceae bacterium]|nr:endonuclease/exonuclease/phosphatase family protein [Paludibacteraceae bacterium]
MNFLRQGSGSNFFSKMVDVPLVAVNVILVVCMALASFSDRVRPTDSLVVSELGLGFPILLVLSVLFMLFWLARLKWSFLISLFGIILSFNCCVKTLAFNKEKDDKDRSFKLMTYNVHLFNFYTELSRNEIVKYLSESDADVLCLQEFGYSTNEKSKHLKEKEIFAELKKKYPYYHIDVARIKNGSYGVAILSRYPILNKGKVEYISQYNSSLYADVEIKGKIIRIYNCHLESNKLTENDKNLVKNFGKEMSTEKMNEVVSHLSKKLSDAYVLRERQADRIASEVPVSPHPVIVCGDFNDVPVSYAYSKIKGDDLNDAFVDAGFGYCYTFRENMFWFRIDHVLYDKTMEVLSYKVGDLKASDHYPVECSFKWK